jgi:hypothetical protein
MKLKIKVSPKPDNPQQFGKLIKKIFKLS